MNTQAEALLSGGRKARLLGHAAGLAAFEAFALAGAAGDLAWMAGLRFVLPLAAADYVLSLLPSASRTLKAARKAGPPPEDSRLRRALHRAAHGWVWRCTGRVALAWIAALALSQALLGLSSLGAFLLAALGLPMALAATAVMAAAATRNLACGEGFRPGPWPGLKPRRWVLRWAEILLAPVLGLSALAVLAVLGLPTGWGAAAAAALALGGAVLAAWDLDGGLEGGLGTLAVRLHGIARGDDDGSMALGSGPWAEVSKACEATARALRTVREEARRFGGLGAPQGWKAADAEETTLRPVAVLAVCWNGVDTALEALEASQRMAALGRFYGAVQKELLTRGATLVECNGGAVVAVWIGPVGGILSREPALEAAWSLQGLLKVLAQQNRFRGRGDCAWGLGLALGEAVSGSWGPPEARRWSLSGAPLERARRFSRQEGGTYLDEAFASNLPEPYRAHVGEKGMILTEGPVGTTQGIGF
jgi:hypothetical protein